MRIVQCEEEVGTVSGRRAYASRGEWEGSIAVVTRPWSRCWKGEWNKFTKKKQWGMIRIEMIIVANCREAGNQGSKAEVE